MAALLEGADVMIAEAGLAALWMAAAMALLQLLLAAGAVWGRASVTDMSRSLRPVAIVQGGLIALAMLCLVLVFVQSDLSVKLVMANSRSTEPLLYKIAGAWGNHAGSMLLWVTMLALSGAAVALIERRLDQRTRDATVGAQALVALAFYTVLPFASNPFARGFSPQLDGSGSNLPLPDLGLALHPLILYPGYVGLSVAFAFAVGALLTGQVGETVARAMRPWVLAALIFLTLDITARSYWTYCAVGGDGSWSWDGAGNAALLAWLAAAALLHAVTGLATRDRPRALTLVLAAIAFATSVAGTFAGHSGVPAGVDSVAGDPGGIAAIPAWLPWLGLVLAGGLTVASGARLWRRGAGGGPFFAWGMAVSHLGLAISLAGTASASALATESRVIARPGMAYRIGPFDVTMLGIRPAIGPDWSAVATDLSVRRGEGAAFTLSPQSRFLAGSRTTTSEPAAATMIDGQLHVLLGRPDGLDGWRLRLRWTPFVTLIWLGGALVALGGALSLLGCILLRREPRIADEEDDA